MAPLHRHQLARLSLEGWAVVLDRPWDRQARECLAHWAEHQLPLVVTRQPPEATAEGLVALGLPAPGRWDRRRLALQVPRAALVGFCEFPRLAEVLHLFPAATRASMLALLAGLEGCGGRAHVFGSHGWQAITGLDHLRPGSDLDLSVAVANAAQADAVAQVLASADDAALPRLDGELLLADGAAVSWREWAAWRTDRVRAVMVRRLDGVALQHDAAWCIGEEASMEASA
jgi:phosphoribosyl-dephospho-CoA transferase